MTPRIEFDEGRHRYTVDGEVFPNVTAICGILPKPALPWWGMCVGVEGVCALHNEGEDIPWGDPQGVVKLLTASKRTVNHVRDSAALRGTSLHRALQSWAEDRKLPDPREFAPDERRFLPGTAKWLLERKPEFLRSEVRVASVTHRFAGTFDYLRKCDDPLCDCDGIGAILGDLKSAKRIYEAHHYQTAAYVLAWDEMGSKPRVCRGEVVQVSPDGAFDVQACDRTAEDFLALREMYRSLKREAPEPLRAAA